MEVKTGRETPLSELDLDQFQYRTRSSDCMHRRLQMATVRLQAPHVRDRSDREEAQTPSRRRRSHVRWGVMWTSAAALLAVAGLIAFQLLMTFVTLD
jgi:hypothetical protein